MLIVQLPVLCCSLLSNSRFIAMRTRPDASSAGLQLPSSKRERVLLGETGVLNALGASARASGEVKAESALQAEGEMRRDERRGGKTWRAQARAVCPAIDSTQTLVLFPVSNILRSSFKSLV